MRLIRSDVSNSFDRAEDDRRSPKRVQLVLPGADGGAWSVTMSKGIERFIGAYVRVPALRPDSKLLQFVEVASALAIVGEEAAAGARRPPRQRAVATLKPPAPRRPFVPR